MWVSYVCQLCVTKILHCEWSVIGRLRRRMSLTRSHHATIVGPIRFSNRSNKTIAFVKSTNDDRLWCAHTVRFFVFSSSLRPTIRNQKVHLQKIEVGVVPLPNNCWMLLLLGRIELEGSRFRGSPKLKRTA